MATNGAPAAPAGPPLQSRPKRPITGDEEAGSTLRLGEFQDVPTLNLSEARTIINAVTKYRRNKDSETLVKTQEYLELFARYKQPEHVHAVEQLLSTRTELDSFERSQLGRSLCLPLPVAACGGKNERQLILRRKSMSGQSRGG